MNISVVHLKHTSTELICDLLELSEENMAITIKDPQTIGVVSQDEKGAQLGFTPFLMKDNIIHIALKDVLFIAEAETQIANQYEQMFSTIAIPSQKIIM